MIILVFKFFCWDGANSWMSEGFKKCSNHFIALCKQLICKS